MNWYKTQELNTIYVRSYSYFSNDKDFIKVAKYFDTSPINDIKTDFTEYAIPKGLWNVAKGAVLGALGAAGMAAWPLGGFVADLIDVRLGEHPVWGPRFVKTTGKGIWSIVYGLFEIGVGSIKNLVSAMGKILEAGGKGIGQLADYIADKIQSNGNKKIEESNIDEKQKQAAKNQVNIAAEKARQKILEYTKNVVGEAG